MPILNIFFAFGEGILSREGCKVTRNNKKLPHSSSVRERETRRQLWTDIGGFWKNTVQWNPRRRQQQQQQRRQRERGSTLFTTPVMRCSEQRRRKTGILMATLRQEDMCWGKDLGVVKRKKNRRLLASEDTLSDLKKLSVSVFLLCSLPFFLKT